jgi:hypothetical protein
MSRTLVGHLLACGCRYSAVPGAVLCTSLGVKTTLRPVFSAGDVLKPVLSRLLVSLKTVVVAPKNVKRVVWREWAITSYALVSNPIEMSGGRRMLGYPTVMAAGSLRLIGPDPPPPVAVRHRRTTRYSYSCGHDDSNHRDSYQPAHTYPFPDSPLDIETALTGGRYGCKRGLPTPPRLCENSNRNHMIGAPDGASMIAPGGVRPYSNIPVTLPRTTGFRSLAAPFYTSSSARPSLYPSPILLEKSLRPTGLVRPDSE